jgi:hypothetical protein
MPRGLIRIVRFRPRTSCLRHLPAVLSFSTLGELDGERQTDAAGAGDGHGEDRSWQAAS